MMSQLNRNLKTALLLLLLLLPALACGPLSSSEEADPTEPAAELPAGNAPAPTVPAPATSVSEPQPAAAAELIDIPLTSVPRSFTYAGAEFEVKSGRLTNESSFDPGQVMPNLRAELIIDARNTTTFDASISNGTFLLAFADGSKVEQTIVDSIGRNSSRTFTVSGDVLLETQWEGASLTLSEQGKEPETIPLTGDMPPAGQPVALVPGSETTALNKYGESMTFRLLEASLWLDAPQPGQYMVRAPLGQRFLMVTVEATNTGGPNGVSVYAEQFQIEADGTRYPFSYDVDGAQSVALNFAAEVSYYFLIPAEAQNILLIVAADGNQPGQVTISRP